MIVPFYFSYPAEGNEVGCLGKETQKFWNKDYSVRLLCLWAARFKLQKKIGKRRASAYWYGRTPNNSVFLYITESGGLLLPEKATVRTAFCSLCREFIP